MELIFSKASLNDVNTIQALANKIWHTHYLSIISIQQINYMLQNMYSGNAISEDMNNNKHFYIAYLNTLPVGFASISNQINKDYFLHKFYVDTTQHRLGIGSNFLAFLEKETQAQKLTLTVNRKNFKAINFYFKKGFFIDKVEDFDIGNGYFMNDFIMVKHL